MSNKLVRDGMVAVIVSPGYGAGWSTWNQEFPEAVFNPDIAQAILEGNIKKAATLADDAYPGIYTGGLHKAVVEWVNQGDRFVIEEYDGSESMQVLGPDFGYTA